MGMTRVIVNFFVLDETDEADEADEEGPLSRDPLRGRGGSYEPLATYWSENDQGNCYFFCIG
jgi:hypothetical protein